MKKTDIFGFGDMMSNDFLKEKYPTPPHAATLTIASLGTKQFEGEVKRTITFAEWPQGPILGLNMTNWSTIEDITGQNDDDRWVGHKIDLYVTRVEFKGKMVDAIRVDRPGAQARAAAPSQPAPSAPPQTHFGDDMASKALAFAGTNGLELADIEQNMLDAGYPAEMVRGGMARWPIGWKDAVRLACQNKPIKPYTGMTADDIPF